MSYSRAIFFLDLVSGSDTARTALSSCNMTNSSGVVTVNKTGHGLVNGAVVTVPSGTYAGDWLIKRTDADNFTLHSRCAIGKMTITGTPSVDETFVLGTQTFTFKTSRGSAGQVTIGATVSARARNIVDAINADLGGVGADYFAYVGSTEGAAPTGQEYVTVHYMPAGTGGNSKTWTESATGITIDGSGTLTGGADSTYSADRSGVSITPFGGMNWTDSWLTITNGATAARIAAGDYIAISKTPDPVSIGNGTWTDCPSGGFSPTTVNISSSTNASPIEITTSSNHNLSTGDVVLVNGHTTNYTANGNWQITYVSATKFTLDGSVGVGTGVTNGTIRKVNSKAVVLATAQTQNVVTTEGGWTGTGDSTVTFANGSGFQKTGYYVLDITLDSSPQANTLQAYKSITSSNFSAYQKISLWIRNYAAIVANNWYVALCSDTSGTIPVDIFRIIAIPSTARWLPLTFEREYSVAFTGGSGTAPTAGTTITGVTSTKTAVVITSTLSSGTWAGNDAAGVMFVHTRSGAFQAEQVNFGGGSDHFDIAGDFAKGNLGSAIQSVAFYTGSATPTAASYIDISNIIACTTNGLALDSLISKNGSAQGGTEGYYGIQSINGKVVVLDNDTNTVSTAGRGYSGTTETVETFIRSTFKTAMAASSSTAVSTINDSGTFGNLIAYEFGYEVGTTLQNGETFFDGLNGYGYGVYANGGSFNTLKYLNFCRYNYGVYLPNCINNEIINLLNCSNNAFGIYFSNTNNNIISSLVNVVNNSINALYLSGSNNNTITITGNIRNNSSTAINLTNSVNNIIKLNNNKNNSSYAVSFLGSSLNLMTDLTAQSNQSATFYNDYGINKIRNASCSETTEFSGTQWSQGILWSYDHDQTDGNHWGFFYGGTFNWQTTTYHGTETGAWKTAITSSDRKSNYKALLPVAELGWTASTDLTLTAWVKKDHATNIACRLVCYADDALGISEVSDTKADDTDWEQLSVTVNSAHANPVFRFYLETWYSAGTGNSYLGSINYV